MYILRNFKFVFIKSLSSFKNLQKKEHTKFINGTIERGQCINHEDMK